MRNANMTIGSSNLKEPTMRITRSRAKALGSSGGLPPRHPSVRQDNKQGLGAQGTKYKRSASDENNPVTNASTACQQPKRRAVLRDVTNVLCENSYMNCINRSKFQVKKFSDTRNSKVTPAILVKRPHNEDRKENTIEEAKKVKIEKSQEHCSQARFKDLTLTHPSKYITPAQCGFVDLMPVNRSLPTAIAVPNTTEKDETKVCQKQEGSDSLGIADIDSKHKDPLMCSLYAPDIYSNLHAMELDRRPSFNYMEKLQRDVNKGMRGILIDWLVEVSEEYRLVPDTLYLTVHLIDRFLSENYIEKQKLQLLGVTCMLIASKYEEICAPRVEEFCFITDNTYSKEEVVRMESLVLNFLGFQLAAPTTKKFLRRFVQAAQASYEVPSVELEFMANYLAELTLVDYSFLKFLPSITAASAVFLAKWTLDQSNHPWNPTLEHYTSYTALELKTTVLLLQDLQLNTSGSTLNAIREKYRQPKFKSVATLSSPEPVQSLF
ncbi:cyclin-A2-2-like [Nicotiana tabacum]|uniref:Cyclin-A2-2-like n=2 Tax=Nicotiana TaxID=4085 RepID=A0A1S4BYX4_TOBAC|nr:PREDICTED: cyclin-A2-2-like [Nicotiana sylvestris]XP_016494107.1 PREDICTED: cyclin-A2-2-like [Nicotiana tabacum]